MISHVWSAIGATAPQTYENSGHNTYLSFIVTGDGVIVANGGAACILMEALHAQIRSNTDQPARLVINGAVQGHAVLENAYLAGRVVPIPAHVDAAHHSEENGRLILARTRDDNRDKAKGTFVTPPTQTFEDRHEITMAISGSRCCTLVPRTDRATFRSGCARKAV